MNWKKKWIVQVQYIVIYHFHFLFFTPFQFLYKFSQERKRMRWEPRKKKFCNDSALTFLQQRCSLIAERSLPYLWALSITKSMCISHCTIWRQRPLFSLQTYHALFSLEISKTCFAIYISCLFVKFFILLIHKYVFLYALRKQAPPFQQKLLKMHDCHLWVWLYSHTQKERKKIKKLMIMIIMQNRTK